MSDEITGLIPLLFSLLLLPGVSVPLVRGATDGSIERNEAAGIRTRHTQASDEAWAAGHAAALPLVRKMWPVATVGLVTATAAQILGDGYTGAANRAARSVMAES